MDPLYIVLGPCSAESREQVLLAAQLLKEECAGIPFIFRAGAWKPRTNPNTFQGVGEEALTWLAEVKDKYDIPVATEVATPEHVQKAITRGVDYLWIGARTSANPIAVEALAKAIRECIAQQPIIKGVFVKNPVSEDTALWLGNIARIERAGVRVFAVHRGCNHQPCWAMAHALRQSRPDIPLLIDPSHMSGEAAKIPALMQKAAVLGYEGAMIEVHPHPEQALSDAQQQITPRATREYLETILGFPISSTPTLAWFRAEIDELDERLWTTLAQRMQVSQRIGAWKQANGIQPLQPERYEQILRERQGWAEQNGLSPEWVQQVFDLIHAESVRRQQKIKN